MLDQLDWAHSATGTMFGDHDLEPGEIELVEKEIRDLLRLS